MRRRRFVSGFGGLALVPFGALPTYADAADGCGVPLARDDGWAVASAGDDKLVDRAALCRMADRLVASQANVHAVLVARSGMLVFERYFSGSDERLSRKVGNVTFEADTLHDMKSVSKSVASLAVGIAVDRGLLRVDEPILSFFPELTDLRSPELDRLRLEDALTMSLGLEWVEATPSTGDEDNDEARMNRSRDPARFVLSLPVTAPAGHAFFYNTGALRLVSTIMRRVTGRPLDDYARETLFEPLGITGTEWNRVKGETDSGGGLRLRPRDMMKIGQLVLAGGRWNGRQIVSKAWIDASTTPHLDATGLWFYGYLWWLGRSLYKGREIHWTAALGRGGQSIRIVPELDLVVAVTAGYYQDYSPQAFQVQASVFKDVLRAVSSTP